MMGQGGDKPGAGPILLPGEDGMATIATPVRFRLGALGGTENENTESANESSEDYLVSLAGSSPLHTQVGAGSWSNDRLLRL